MKLLAGTSGYSYAAWKGGFYPADVKSAGMLEAYARRLPAVEINSSFYRMPRRSVLETWAGQVPDEFRFAIKASRRITHFKRLADAGDELRYLVDGVGVLGERLGALLFQLHPHAQVDLPRLRAFLDELPDGLPAAFEFRHRSWRDPGVLELLARRDCALVFSDALRTGNDDELVATATWGYIRLRRDSYDDTELRTWRRRLQTTGWTHALVFFKHEEQGPLLAERLLATVGG